MKSNFIILAAITAVISLLFVSCKKKSPAAADVSEPAPPALTFTETLTPNPSKGRVLLITAGTGKARCVLKIYTQAFRCVAEKQLADNTAKPQEIDLTPFASGAYVACLEAEENGAAQRKVKPFVILKQ